MIKNINKELFVIFSLACITIIAQRSRNLQHHCSPEVPILFSMVAMLRGRQAQVQVL